MEIMHWGRWNPMSKEEREPRRQPWPPSCVGKAEYCVEFETSLGVSETGSMAANQCCEGGPRERKQRLFVAAALSV